MKKKLYLNYYSNLKYLNLSRRSKPYSKFEIEKLHYLNSKNFSIQNFFSKATINISNFLLNTNSKIEHKFVRFLKINNYS